MQRAAASLPAPAAREDGDRSRQGQQPPGRGWVEALCGAGGRPQAGLCGLLTELPLSGQRRGARPPAASKAYLFTNWTNVSS